jgi:hypothetical protein
MKDLFPTELVTKVKPNINYVTKYLKAKEEWWKFKYFTMQQYNLWKNPSKGNQNPSRYYYNSITNLQVWTQAKISSFKNPHIKNRPITYLGAYKNPLKLLYSIMNLNTISFLPLYRAGQQNTTLRARTKGQTPKGGAPGSSWIIDIFFQYLDNRYIWSQSLFKGVSFAYYKST